ncbi:hypothetical protein PInf_005090 [Phytophthora infestans]|nr:hypothetical protein PInf_005090 [Phytophthora infestans]
MGNAAPRAQPQSVLDSASQYRTFLMDYTPRSMDMMFGSLIGDGKFLKSILAMVKIYRKYDERESLTIAEVALRRLALAFSVEQQPNVIPYADFQLSNKYNVAFMVRQYFASNLYDRICSRPFLTMVEKKWIAFQILRALEQSHAKGICHGDINRKTSCGATGSTPGTGGINSMKTPDAAMMLSKMADSEVTVEEVDKQILAMGLGSGTMAGTPMQTPPSTTSTGSAPSSYSRSRREGSLLESMDIFSAGRGGKVPDARIRLVCKYYGRLVREIAATATGGDQQTHVAQRVLEELEQKIPTKHDKQKAERDNAALTKLQKMKEKENDMPWSELHLAEEEDREAPRPV